MREKNIFETSQFYDDLFKVHDILNKIFFRRGD